MCATVTFTKNAAGEWITESVDDPTGGCRAVIIPAEGGELPIVQCHDLNCDGQCVSEETDTYEEGVLVKRVVTCCCSGGEG